MPIGDRDREVGLVFLIDTNRINARQRDPDMNQIEEWSVNGVIGLEMPLPAYDESLRGFSETRTRKTLGNIWTDATSDSSSNKVLCSQVAQVLFGNRALSRAEETDVLIVVSAINEGYPLITNDGGSNRQPGGILGNRNALRSLGATVLTAREAVEIVRRRIRVRDENLTARGLRENIEIPSWVGRD